jgi:hypothetical protein
VGPVEPSAHFSTLPMRPIAADMLRRAHDALASYVALSDEERKSSSRIVLPPSRVASAMGRLKAGPYGTRTYGGAALGARLAPDRARRADRHREN